eukprot:1085121-Rhodomonas_salina.1
MPFRVKDEGLTWYGAPALFSSSATSEPATEDMTWMKNLKRKEEASVRRNSIMPPERAEQEDGDEVGRQCFEEEVKEGGSKALQRNMARSSVHLCVDH